MNSSADDDVSQIYPLLSIDEDFDKSNARQSSKPASQLISITACARQKDLLPKMETYVLYNQCFVTTR